jgi:S1-C subfamily serine protease
MTFDTEEAGCSVATGFVVDAKRGLILTNRHVVHQGPVTAEAVFQNNEEVPVFQVYSDPVREHVPDTRGVIFHQAPLPPHYPR